MEVTVQVSPAAKKVYDFLRPNMDLLLYKSLKTSIVKQLTDECLPSLYDLDEAVQLLTELDTEIYKDFPTSTTSYRIKDKHLWFLVKSKNGTPYWCTVAEHGVFITEEA